MADGDQSVETNGSQEALQEHLGLATALRPRRVRLDGTARGTTGCVIIIIVVVEVSV